MTFDEANQKLAKYNVTAELRTPTMILANSRKVDYTVSLNESHQIMFQSWERKHDIQITKYLKIVEILYKLAESQFNK